MTYSTIGKDTIISKLCFGCEPLGGYDWGDVDIYSIEESIEYAVDKGVNFFDTADIYGLGLSESRLSKILGNRRHNMQIATKGGVSWESDANASRAITRMNSSPKYLQKAINDSLSRLKLDFLPIYYVHWPDEDTDIEITFEFLQDQKDRGKIGLIGCSNYNAKQIKQACSVADISILQLPCNILNKTINNDIINICNENKLGIISYNVLANGLLTGKYQSNTIFDSSDRRSKLNQFKGKEFKRNLDKINTIKQYVKKSNLTLSQYAIKSINEYDFISSSIVGIKSFEQIKENIKGVI